jgi:hypothetical protein
MKRFKQVVTLRRNGVEVTANTHSLYAILRELCREFRRNANQRWMKTPPSVAEVTCFGVRYRIVLEPGETLKGKKYVRYKIIDLE